MPTLGQGKPIPSHPPSTRRHRAGGLFKSFITALGNPIAEFNTSSSSSLPQMTAKLIRSEEDQPHSNASQRSQSNDPRQLQTVQSSRGRGINPYEALEVHHHNELIMRWLENPTHLNASSQSLRSSLPYQPAPQLPEEDPSLIRIIFSPLDNGAMVVLPSSTLVSSTPLFHISWYEDYFLPGSFITTIRRGGNDQGPVVGRFDLKGNQKAAIVHFGSAWRWLDDILSLHKNQHKWQFGRNVLYWSRSPTTSGIVLSCKLVGHSKSNNDIIAKFISPPDQVSRTDLCRSCQLAVSREHGDYLLDEILLSALIIESKYLSSKLIWVPH